MRTGTSATLLWFITLSCIVRCSSLVSLSTPVAETAANATKVATEVLSAKEGRNAGDAKHVGSVKTQTKGPERKRQFLERFAEAKGSIEVPNAEVAETHLDEQAAWNGPYTSEGVGLVGSLAASLDQCKARCMAETSCHVVHYSENDTHDGYNCFLFDSQADTVAQYKTFRIYRIKHEAQVLITRPQRPLPKTAVWQLWVSARFYVFLILAVAFVISLRQNAVSLLCQGADHLLCFENAVPEVISV